MLEDSIDKVKASPKLEIVVLVGGGSAIWSRKLVGAKEVIKTNVCTICKCCRSCHGIN